jgi:hypothetical protein
MVVARRKGLRASRAASGMMRGCTSVESFHVPAVVHQPFRGPAQPQLLVLPMGEFESGLTAGCFGLVRAIWLGGAATLAVTGIWAVMFAVLSRMDRFPRHAKQ